MKNKCKNWNCSTSSCGATSGCSYFLGFLGAAVYYIGTAPTFWTSVLGFLKAIVWPAFLVYDVLHFLGV